MKSERGAVLVEFAVVIPVLLLVVFSLFEFGRFTVSSIGVTSAVRDGARYGIGLADGDNGVPRYVDCDAVRSAAAGTSVLGRPDPTDITIAYDHGPGTAEFMTCDIGTTSAPWTISTGDRLIVKVDATFNTSVPFVSLFLDGVDMSAVGRRTIIKDL